MISNMEEYFSIIIPVFNTSESLKKLVVRINNVFRDALKEQCEIILVNDASTNPETAPALIELNKNYDNVKVIMLAKNSGQYSAILCGMSHAKGDYIITMDDDLQHLPEMIPKLVEERQHDAVFARFKTKQHGLNKILFSRLRTMFNPKKKGNRKLYLSGFALYRRHIVDSLLQIDSSFAIVGSNVCRLTDDLLNVDVEHAERKEGKSGYSLRKMFRLFNNFLFNNSAVLVKLIFLFSFLAFLAGLIILIILLNNRFFNDIRISAIDMFISLTLFLSSFILISIGIAGEYIRRVLVSVERKPAYVVKEILEKKKE